MSEEKKKTARFDLSGIRQQPQATPAAPPLPAEPEKVEDDLEQFGAYMIKSLKRALKQAAFNEDRKQYELLHDAVMDYLTRHHPTLLKK